MDDKIRRLAGENLIPPPGVDGMDEDGCKESRSSPRKDSKHKDSQGSRSHDRHSRSRSRGRRRSRSRGRDISPSDRRRFGTSRRRRSRERIVRSPERNRNRSRDRRDNRREKRGRSRSHDRYPRSRRSRSHSGSPVQSRRWDPMMKKPASPPAAPQYTVPMAGVYSDAYTNYPTQYVAPQFGSYEFNAQVPPPPSFAPAYPPPPPVLSQPVPPGDDFNAPTWRHAQSAHELCPPAVPEPVEPVKPTENDDKLRRDAAVAQEVKNQREQLKIQRNDYLKRQSALKREMKILKEQRSDLNSSGAPLSPTTKGFLKENDRLQLQIQNKLNTIENVVDMLSSIIGEQKQPSPPVIKKSKKVISESAGEDDDSSPERLKSKLIESMKTKRDVKKESDSVPITAEFSVKEEEAKKPESSAPNKRVNYIFYDPEMHWCQICDVFPKTAKDYLNHLHSAQHTEKIKVTETPWHDLFANDEMPTYSNVPAKRTPIRGLQFFSPATSWYCKLCDFWMGDLHCASAHLKSKTHSQNYNAYVEQYPHFEIDWMADRQKVYDTIRDNDVLPSQMAQITSVSTTGMDLLESIPLQINNQKSLESDEKKNKRKKKKSAEKLEKRKKKRSKKRRKSSSSSSSSSSSDSSDSDSEQNKIDKEDRSSSIRVAMRNLMKSKKEGKSLDVEARGKWTTVQEGHANSENPAPVPPPPPVVTKVEAESRKKDEAMIMQWSTPQPIISESEKKLLEELKGKLKNKPNDENSNKFSNKQISKDIRSRDRSPKGTDSKNKSVRNRDKDRKSPSPGKGRNRRSKSRDRRSRSRSRGRLSPDRRRKRSRSPRLRSPNNRYGGRRRSYSRSRSRSRGHRIEKPIVRYPEFRPRVPPENKKVTKVKTEEESERKKSPIVKKASATASTSGKKLPFIGRMPVFKKQSQGSDSEKKEGEAYDDAMMEMHMNYDHFNAHAMMVDYEDLMPDPMQFVSLMGAPPPPPSEPPPTNAEDDKDILPPGIDETEDDLIPKPISDAPIPRKGPLPKDFEEALNIIFPGEKVAAPPVEKKPIDIAQPQPSLQDLPLGTILESPPEPSVDETSQQSVCEPPFNGFPVATYAAEENNSPLQNITDSPLAPLAAAVSGQPPPPPPSALGLEQQSPLPNLPKKEISVDEKEKTRRNEELDDLALLGIDADDMAAQCM